MERSAIYRRALAPVMLMLGGLGISAGVAGYFINIFHRENFVLYWLGVGAAGLAGAYLQVRAQALREHEEFWSPPTKRVTQALMPALVVGAIFGLGIGAPVTKIAQPLEVVSEPAWWLVCAWMLLYGCAVHASGFFMPRGFKLFGWAFIWAGCFCWIVLSRLEHPVTLQLAHLLMGIVFGGSHLAYGVYLAITEKHRGDA